MGAHHRRVVALSVAALHALLAAFAADALGWCIYKNAGINADRGMAELLQEGSPGGVPDAAACLKECSERADCNAFTYDVLDRSCTLYNVPANFPPVGGSSRQPAFVGINDSSCFYGTVDACFVSEADIAMHNLFIRAGNGNVTATIEDCYTICDKTSSCGMFTYNTADRKCWLKQYSGSKPFYNATGFVVYLGDCPDAYD